MNKKMICSILAACVLTGILSGCGGKIEIGSAGSGASAAQDMVQLTGTLQQDNDALYIKDGTSYEISIDGKSQKVRDFYLYDDVRTAAAQQKNKINARLSGFSEDDGKVRADIQIITKEEMKVPTAYGYLNYPADLSESVRVRTERTENLTTYTFAYMPEDGSDAVPMFAMSYGKSDQTPVFQLDVKTDDGAKAVNLYVQSFEMPEENPLPEEECTTFYQCQESINYVLEHMEFNEGVSLKTEQ